MHRLALNGSFTIFYIIGDAGGTSGADWAALPGLAGVTHVFASPAEACDNCGRQEHQAHLVTSTSPVTSLLLDYVEAGRLASMGAGDVEPFLVANLKWRVQTVSPELHLLDHGANEAAGRLLGYHVGFLLLTRGEFHRPRAKWSILARYLGTIR